MYPARTNPIGMPAPSGITLVRVGRGKHTHVEDPQGGVLCRSGKNAGRKAADGTDRRGGPQQFYRAAAQYVTCYRCQKLVRINIEAGRRPDEGP